MYPDCEMCGLANGAIPGIDLRTNSSNPIIVFNNLEKYSLGVTFTNMVTKSSPLAHLPVCPSRIHQIVAQQFDANSYNVSSQTSITCVP